MAFFGRSVGRHVEFFHASIAQRKASSSSSSTGLFTSNNRKEERARETSSRRKRRRRRPIYRIFFHFFSSSSSRRRRRNQQLSPVVLPRLPACLPEGQKRAFHYTAFATTVQRGKPVSSPPRPRLPPSFLPSPGPYLIRPPTPAAEAEKRNCFPKALHST